MDEFVISDDIYKEAIEGLTDNSYVISTDILEETASLTPEVISRELMQSFHFSGRYWLKIICISITFFREWLIE